MKNDVNKKWAMITKINKELDEIYHKMAVHYNLSDSTFWVLYALYEIKEPCTQKQICDYWYYNKQTINSAIKNLEKQGYIKMGYIEENKTNKKIGLTQSGIKFAEKTVGEMMEIEDRAFSKTNEEELDIVVNFFKKSLVSLKEELNSKIK